MTAEIAFDQGYHRNQRATEGGDDQDCEKEIKGGLRMSLAQQTRLDVRVRDSGIQAEGTKFLGGGGGGGGWGVGGGGGGGLGGGGGGFCVLGGLVWGGGGVLGVGGGGAKHKGKKSVHHIVPASEGKEGSLYLDTLGTSSHGGWRDFRHLVPRLHENYADQV